MADLLAIYDQCVAEREAREDSRYTPPLVRLWDSQWRLISVARDYLSLEARMKLNDVGEARLELDPTSPLAQSLMAHADGVAGRSVFITIDKNGVRFSGRLRSYQLSTSREAQKVAFTFLDEIAELKNIIVWPNPFLPAGIQAPKYWTWFGPVKYGLKLTLFCNLLRLSGNLWNIPDNPLDPTTWVEGILPSQWPNIVSPSLLVGDGSEWGIISSRMEDFFSVAKPICDEHGLMITYRRYLDGDPSPMPFQMRNGQCVWDIVEKGSWLGETAIAGNIATGLARTVQRYTDDLVDTVVESVANPVNPPEYSQNGSTLFTLKKAPYVILRHNYGLANLTYTRETAGAIQVVTGGHSAPGVNEAISLPIKLVGNVLGAIIPGGQTLGDIADSVLKNIYEDVFLAFAKVKNPIRAAQEGWNPVEEAFIDAPGKSYTLSMMLTLVRGFYQTREKSSHQIDIGDGAPYVVGANGEGHFGLGDRIGAEVPFQNGRVVVEQVQELTLLHDAKTAPVWSVKLGDPHVDEMPIDRLFRDTGKLYKAVRNLGVL